MGYNKKQEMINEIPGHWLLRLPGGESFLIETFPDPDRVQHHLQVCSWETLLQAVLHREETGEDLQVTIFTLLHSVSILSRNSSLVVMVLPSLSETAQLLINLFAFSFSYLHPDSFLITVTYLWHSRLLILIIKQFTITTNNTLTILSTFLARYYTASWRIIGEVSSYE